MSKQEKRNLSRLENFLISFFCFLVGFGCMALVGYFCDTYLSEVMGKKKAMGIFVFVFLAPSLIGSIYAIKNLLEWKFRITINFRNT